MKIGITGINGRMGKSIEQCAGAHEAITHAVGFKRGDNIHDFISSVDVIIDFTRPDASMFMAKAAHDYAKPIVIGTTGFTDGEFKTLKEYSAKTAILWSANMSVGVNLLLGLIEKSASILGEDYDAEIFEMHHKHKVDAPSGTALALGNALAKGRGVELNDVMTPARHGITGERKKGTIGFSVARGGDVIGDHNVIFAGDGERIEIAHKASNRDIFAKGSIRAAFWLLEKPSGYYSMQDVLGL